MSRFGGEVHLRLAQRPRIDLDWRRFFEEFSKLHGGNPVALDGRLVFEDGWSCSDSDYAGPQFPPPEDPRVLRGMMRNYWQERLNIVRARLTQSVKELEGLEQLAARLGEHGKIAFLRVWVPKEGGGYDLRRKTIDEHVNDPLLRQVITFLHGDLARCRTKLKEMTDAVYAIQ